MAAVMVIFVVVRVYVCVVVVECVTAFPVSLASSFEAVE
jgi:hypothetical protein